MRTLIKGYTFTAGTRSIDCSNCNTFDIENVRLIVNETQKVGICSSMQKDLIVSIVDGVITYAETLPILAEDDKLTIEIDYSYNISSGLMNKGLLTNKKSMLELLTNGNFNSDTSIQIDDNVIETISRSYAFYGMVNLTSVSMSNLKTIGNSAFNGCTNLTAVTLPAAQTIGDSAFRNCSNITAVTLPAAQSILGYAFNGCTNVTTVALPAAQTIGTYAFNDCTNLTAVTLPAAQSILGYAFNGCTNLTAVTLPAAQSILGYAFNGCTNLTAVTLPAAQTIGDSAFRNCSNITAVTLGKLTSFVSGNTFTGCYKLSNIIIGADTNINLDFSSLSHATWNANIDASIWNENFVSGIINNLFDFTSGVAHTIKCGAFPYAKLTPETIALAAAKNWNITA